MNDTPAVYKKYQCWNSPTSIPVDGFVHLSAHVAWVEGNTLVKARSVEEPEIVECPELKCEVTLDDEWMTVIVHGPGEIPARATVVVKMRREISVLLPKKEVPKATDGVAEGDLL